MPSIRASDVDSIGGVGMETAPRNIGPESPPATTVKSEVPLPQVAITTDAVEIEGDRERPSGNVAAAVADERLQTWNFGGSSRADHISNRPKYHPGTRVRVDAAPRLGPRMRRSKAGNSLARKLQAGLRNLGYWPFRNCYENVARHHSDPGGRTRLRLIVRSDGRVVRSRLVASNLRSREIGACHAAAARQLRLPPIQLRQVDVDVDVSVWPGDLPLLALPSQSPSASNLDLGGVSRILLGMESSVERCLRQARSSDAKIWGRLALSFAIGDNHRPTAIREHQSHFPDAEATSCVRATLEGIEVSTQVPSGLRLVAAWKLYPAAETQTESSSAAEVETTADSEPDQPVPP